jgi:undecaprenyl-diphosphatase
MANWNLVFFNLIHGWSGHFVFADVLGIFFAEYLPYLLVLGFLVLVFQQSGARRKFYLFAEGTLAIILARGIIAEVIGFFYSVARPFALLGFSPLIAESGPSFPSAHMAWFFALATAIWFTDRKWGMWYLALSAVMGVARIYVGVHWPLDILCGAAIGVISAWFVNWLFKDTRAALWRTENVAPDGIASREESRA